MRYRYLIVTSDRRTNEVLSLCTFYSKMEAYDTFWTLLRQYRSRLDRDGDMIVELRRAKNTSKHDKLVSALNSELVFGRPRKARRRIHSILGVWDYELGRLAFYKVYHTKSEYDKEERKISALYWQIGEGSRYDIIDTGDDDEEDLLSNREEWAESLMKHGYPHNDLSGWKHAIKKYGRPEDRRVYEYD